MPTYHACGVSVRLGVAPLVDTVHPDIVLNKADIDKKRCEEVEQNLLKSELLREKRLSFPGDERDFELNWLGNVPFMQVQAGHDLFRLDNDDAPEFAATTVNPSHLQQHAPTYSTTTLAPGPLALSLHVLSSDRTFASGLDNQNRQHLKIEVLFNGKLSNCFFLPPYEVRSGTKTHHQVFAGYRTDYLAERPWVILPPRVCADGSFAMTENSTAPETRWKDICQALSQEANARGSDRQGNLPPSATFLRALADMDMSYQTKAMHKPNIKSFGVIDVLITAGYGRKVTSGKGYLKAPQRFIDDSFSSHHQLAVPQAGLTSTTSAVAQAGQSRSMPTPLKDPGEEDAEGESDSDDEHPFKRRAMTPLILLKSRDSRPGYPVTSETSIEYERKSTMSVPLEAMPAESLFPATPTVSSSAAPILGLRDGLDELTSFPERGGATSKEYIAHHGQDLPENSSFHTPQEPCNFPSSSIGFARTPRMRPLPYSSQFSDQTFGDPRSAPIHVPAYSNAAFPSSPLQQDPLSMNRPVRQFLSRIPTSGNGQHSDGYTLGSATLSTMNSMLPRRSSFGLAHAPSSVSTVTKVWSDEEYDFPREDETHSPAYVPNMLPASTPFGHYGNSVFGSLSFSSPFDRRYSMPLPQTGLFSVTTKPKSGAYAKKVPQMTGPEDARRTYQLRRLIITGKKSIPVIDHSWAVPQCITLKCNDSDFSSSIASSTPASLIESSVYTEIASSQRSSGSSYHAKPEQSNLANASFTQASNRNAFGDGHGSKPTRSLQAPERDADSELKIDSIAVSEPAEPSHNAYSGTGKLNKGPTPQQRTASGTQIRGVQGPKATTFWLDDPEEILRGSTKAQRSKPPVKRKNTTSTTVQLKEATQVSDTPIVPATSSSSPLSSPPTTPELEAGTLIGTTNITSTAIPKAGPKDPIAQIDGTLERKMAVPLLPKLTPSPKELDLTATPQLPATSKTITTTNAKKRKTPHRSPAKPSRNPGRHKTVDNPPLNQNCVIAFAESVDKKSEKGVLRQVKSERQGVFKEEYVVFATRFFVAGN